MILPGRGTTGRIVASLTGKAASRSRGGSRNRSLGVSAPSSATPVIGMAVWSSTAPANGCPSFRTEAKRIGGPFRPWGGKGNCEGYGLLVAVRLGERRLEQVELGPGDLVDPVAGQLGGPLGPEHAGGRCSLDALAAAAARVGEPEQAVGGRVAGLLGDIAAHRQRAQAPAGWIAEHLVAVAARAFGREGPLAVGAGVDHEVSPADEA